MNGGRYRSFIALIYLCLFLFIVIFIITTLFGLLGYWIGEGDSMVDFLRSKIISYLKAGFAGVLIGFILWFFYYRKI